MSRLLALLSICSTLLVGQTDKPLEITKVVHVRYAVPKAIADLLNPGQGGFIAVADNGMKAVVLKGRPDKIAEAEQTIKELDVPPAGESAHDIEVTVYVIGGTSKIPVAERRA
jgi:type II secretory pathway component GspD/PulD (secretin)